MTYARILSTGRYVPARIVTNAEIEARLGEPVCPREYGAAVREFLSRL